QSCTYGVSNLGLSLASSRYFIIVPFSIPFPYTTLFRSRGLLEQDPPPGDRVTVLAVGKAAPAMTRGAVAALGERTSRIVIVTDQDRKSTRLNSSHVKSSYAVFCLKKKKTIIV